MTDQRCNFPSCEICGEGVRCKSPPCQCANCAKPVFVRSGSVIDLHQTRIETAKARLLWGLEVFGQ